MVDVMPNRANLIRECLVPVLSNLSFSPSLFTKSFYWIQFSAKEDYFVRWKKKTFLMFGIFTFLVVRLLFITTAGFCWQIIQLATISESICPAGREWLSLCEGGRGGSKRCSKIGNYTPIGCVMLTGRGWLLFFEGGVKARQQTPNTKWPGLNAWKHYAHHQALCLMFCITTIMKWHVLKPNYAFLGELEVGDSCWKGSRGGNEPIVVQILFGAKIWWAS